MPSDALAAPQMPPISEILPRGGTQKSVEGRWTHHVRCFFVPLTHRPDVCGWFGRWGRLGLRHLGVPLVSARRAPAETVCVVTSDLGLPLPAVGVFPSVWSIGCPLVKHG